MDKLINYIHEINNKSKDMNKLSEMPYSTPILIYDNFCSLCTKLAQFSRIMSRGRIYLVGHYTQKGQQIKAAIFPEGFDPNKMFWMVTSKGAFGARSALLPLLVEIIKGLLGIGQRINYVEDVNLGLDALCNISSCSSSRGFFSRLYGLIKNSKKIRTYSRVTS